MKWGARVLRVRSVSREEVWASAGVQGYHLRYEGRTAGCGAGLCLRGPGGARPTHHATTTAAATIVLVVALAIFMRRNPGAAEDGSVKVLIVARVIVARSFTN